MSAATALRPSLSVRDLTVRRGERTLFEGLSFAAAPGEAVLVTGPNGAGKTSLLLAIAGIVRSESGNVSYGEDRRALERALHLLLPLPGLKPRLSVAENLGFWRAVNGADGIEVEPALTRVGLGGLGALEAGHLSSGQLRRLALARLLVSQRPLWLLDEPTAALDTQGDALVADLIASHRAEGGIAVATTHHDLSLGDKVQTIVLGQAA